MMTLMRTVMMKLNTNKYTNTYALMLLTHLYIQVFNLYAIFVLISAHASLSAHHGRFRKRVHKRTLLGQHIGILHEFYTLL